MISVWHCRAERLCDVILCCALQAATLRRTTSEVNSQQAQKPIHHRLVGVLRDTVTHCCAHVGVLVHGCKPLDGLYALLSGRPHALRSSIRLYRSKLLRARIETNVITAIYENE